jgi:hypothetical protein
MITKILKDNPIGYFESEYNPFEKMLRFFELYYIDYELFK